MPGAPTVGFCSAEVKPPGPVHANIGLGALVVEVSCTVGAPQVSVPPVAEAEGRVVLPVTAVEAVAVQPFEVFVTVTL